jgi:hypothetical protein
MEAFSQVLTRLAESFAIAMPCVFRAEGVLALSV